MKTKLFVPFTLIVTLALVLSACGPAATTAAPATAAPATDAPATDVPVATAPAVKSPIPVVLNMPDQIAGGRPVAITVAGTPPDSARPAGQLAGGSRSLPGPLSQRNHPWHRLHL